VSVVRLILISLPIYTDLGLQTTRCDMHTRTHTRARAI